MTDGMAVELNMKVYLNFWQVTVAYNYLLEPDKKLQFEMYL